MDLRDKRYQQHRCYKLVSLIHINRKLDFFFTVAARVVPGRRHECPILYELVDEVIRAVGRDVIKVLIVDRGFIDGAQMGRLQQDYRIETILPVRTNMDLYADALGLTRLCDFRWEPYVAATPPAPPPAATPKPARVVKREAKRQQTLAQRKAELEAEAQGGYDLRPAIEERHRQYKCFWDLTRMHSCAFALVVNQALFVLLGYTLLQAHLVLRRRQELNRSVWERAWQLLSPTLEVVAVYYHQRFCLLTLAEYGRILLDVAEPVRGKLRDRLQQIERQQYSLLETARPP